MKRTLLLSALICLAFTMAYKASLATVTVSFSVNRTTICQNGTVTFTNTTTASPGSRLSYYWTFPSGLPASCNTQNPTGAITFYEPSAPMVQLQVYDTTTGMYYYYEHAFTTVLGLPSVSVTASSTSLNCSTDSVTMTASASAGTSHVVWTRPSSITDTSYVEIAHVAGNYQFIAIDTNGCSSYTNSIYINGSMIFGAQLQLDGDFSRTVNVCSYPGEIFGIYANLSGSFTSPLTYVWNTGTSSSYMLNITTTGDYAVTITDAHGCVAKDTVHAVLNPYPSSTITMSPTSVCVGDTATISAVPGCHYHWASGDTTQTVHATTSGDHPVTITGPTGCMTYAGFYAVFNVSPTVYVAADHSMRWVPGSIVDTSFLCSNTGTSLGEGITSGWSSSFHYLWNTGDTTAGVHSCTTGMYRVTVTTAEGCHGTDSTYMVVNNPPDSTIHPSILGTLCSGSTLILRLTSGASMYSWNTGSTSDSIIVSSTGVFNCTVTNTVTGCSANSGEYVATFATTPAPTVSAGPCIATIGVTDSSAHYQWSSLSGIIPGATNSYYTITTAGFYQVRETSSAGCTSMAPFEWITCGGTGGGSTDSTLVVASFIQSSTTLCHPDSVSFTNTSTGDTSLLTFLWTLDGSSISTSRNVTIFATTGSHTIVLRATNGAHVSYFTSTVFVDSFHIKAYASSDAIGTLIDSIATVCKSDNPSVGVLLPLWSTFSISWNTGSSLSEFGISTSGEYVVAVTDSHGCTNHDSIYVLVNNSPDSAIGAVGHSCIGDTVTVVTVYGPTNSYLWSNGETANYVSVTSGGIYSVTITDVNGCTSHNHYAVTFSALPEPTVLVGGDCTLGCSILADSFYWYQNGTLVPSSDTQYLHTTSSGFYSVKVVTGGCANTSTSVSYSCTSGVEELTTNSVEFFPNPFTDNIAVRGLTEESTVIITNMLGQEVAQQKGTKIILSTSQLIPGIYSISIKNKDGLDIKHGKIVKN